MRIPDWHEYFMRHVYLAASKSKDTNTKIGAVLVKDRAVISEGYNGICRGVSDAITERYERPEKYFWFEHGERNAIFNAARRGIATEGAVLYTQGVPCSDCARAVIQAGISRVYIHARWSSHLPADKWIESCVRSTTMFLEAGVEVVELGMELGIKALFNSQIVEV